MALNPFFLQGTRSEQRLVQDLINEHLTIHGIEVTYIPRKFVNRKTILEEVQSSKFDDNYSIEAYLNTYEGYSGQGDVLTKFGISLRDEVTLTISKERFEDFISPFMAGLDDGTENSIMPSATRPREGDLVYFPLGQRLFEIKFVEHEDPFYQLGKNYVYQLKCELFEYEDEIIDTTIHEIDTQVQDEGYISTLQLVGVGRTAQAVAVIRGSTNDSGFVSEIFLNNDGYGFTSAPIIGISTSPTGSDGDNATAVGFITTRGGVTSIEKILITNAGSGYTEPPTISFIGGGGAGAAATCSIETVYQGVISFNIIDGGVGYSTTPTVTVSGPGAGTTAVGIASVGRAGSNDVIKGINIVTSGRGYINPPSVTIADPPTLSGIGTYIFNEIVEGERSKTQARVKHWDHDTKILQISNVGIGTTTPGFFDGESIIGKTSGAIYGVQSYSDDDKEDKYNDGDVFESEADKILDFTETNPFGNY